MEQSRIDYLLEKYLAHHLSLAERDELLHLLTQPQNKGMVEAIKDRISQDSVVPVITSEEHSEKLFRKIINADKIEQVPPASRLPSPASLWWAAAAILLLVATKAIYWSPNNSSIRTKKIARKVQDIVPGKEGAILTLSDGSQVNLDDQKNGLVANQNGVAVVLKDGQLAYKLKGSAADTTVFNTISTPKGRQFMLVLPDNSKVWLNSATVLRYPTVFSKNERRVEVSGEAYFEVAKNPAKKFRVNMNGKAALEVLGTHFNVNAYANDGSIKTTLLEGSVKMVSTSDLQTVTLKPGQQGQLSALGSQPQLKVNEEVDLGNVMAWKNGLFNFEGMHLNDVLKQLERWYDIEVTYEGSIPDIEFYGELNRNNSLNEILTAFKDADVHFRLEGRRLIVTP